MNQLLKSITSRGNENSKVVALAKNSDRLKPQQPRAHFAQQTPRSKRFEIQIRLQVYQRARYYDVVSGEFTSQDPIEYINGMSLYRGCFVPGAIDPTGTFRRDLIKDRKLCAKRMEARRNWISQISGQVEDTNRAGKTIMKGRTGLSNCRRCRDCDVVTFIIMIAHSCEESTIDRISGGHAGVGVGDEYFDVGPGPLNLTTGNPVTKPWWDGNVRGGDANLDQIIRGAAGPVGGINDVFKIEWCVKKDKAAKIEKWWEDIYKNPREFGVPGTHCTSCAMESISGDAASEWSTLAPVAFLIWISENLKHQCGGPSGKPVRITHINKERLP